MKPQFNHRAVLLILAYLSLLALAQNSFIYRMMCKPTPSVSSCYKDKRIDDISRIMLLRADLSAVV